jgi:hypothetical protein
MAQDCFADEIAIDFPSVDLAVERMREAFLGERLREEGGATGAGDGVVRREITLSRREAWDGLLAPIEVPIRNPCRRCSGHGGSWSEPCEECQGAGVRIEHHVVPVTVPRGVVDGARIRCRVSAPGAESVRVEVQIMIMNRVIE